MPVPICLDETFFAEQCRRHFSKPQYQYFVTVLLGLMLCESRRVLSAMVRQVSQASDWQAQEVAQAWRKRLSSTAARVGRG